MDYQQPMDKINTTVVQKSSSNYVVALIVIAIVALVAWYFWPSVSLGPTNGSTTELSVGDTTEAINKDLVNEPSSSSLDAELDSLGASVSSF